MKVLIISPGKAHDAMVADGIAEYQKRLSKSFPLEWAHPRASDKETEGAAILKLLKDGDCVVLLDERGRDIDTPGLARLLDKQMQAGSKRLVVIIGGAFGVSDKVATRAETTLKLSSLVFPHMLVRLMVAEQLYRASSILSGGKYHHE
ncbi:MAG: rRNA ((1915)-N(3))-methyltransferase RlmH [Candidatus Adlerbacteria bacterium]|nr:rRNA ((1915)-N(3))-methyltransferase RlmH [Candidatus Adlerbacteria bacterium]